MSDAGIAPAAGASAQAPLSAEMILNQSCGPSTETNKCYRCEEQRCCQTYERYAADPEAVRFKECFVACDANKQKGRSCALFCNEQHPAGTANFAPRMACVEHRCGETDGCANVPPDPCVACMREHCAVEMVELTSTRDGFLHKGCIELCDSGDTPCQEECHARFPDLQQSLVDVGLCLESHCRMCSN